MTSLPRHRTVSDVMTSRVHVAGPQAPFKLLVRLIDENRGKPLISNRKTGAAMTAGDDFCAGDFQRANELVALVDRHFQ